jgi:orotidine-5'-phosphate decarboxylase
MLLSAIVAEIYRKRSFLCVGLDPDIHKLPPHLFQLENPVFEFNRKIIDSTASYCVAYKLNTAFFESQGRKGWNTLFDTISYIKTNYPEIFVIADAKRADIGNTSKEYARAFFGSNNSNERFDAITVSPYMGFDSVKPFLEFENHWTILLGLTSNPGSSDFQLKTLENNNYLFEEVLSKAGNWANHEKLMIVIGATQNEQIQKARNILPHHFFLVPGVGAQGGSLSEVVKYGMNSNCGLLVNSSRGIIFSSSNKNFAEEASKKAQELQLEMADFLI